MDPPQLSEQTEKDFHKFSPANYLRENYSNVEQEDVHHLNCLADAFGKVNGYGLKLLEFGGGPTLYQLMSAAPKVSLLTFLPMIVAIYFLSLIHISEPTRPY